MKEAANCGGLFIKSRQAYLFMPSFFMPSLDMASVPHHALIALPFVNSLLLECLSGLIASAISAS